MLFGDLEISLPDLDIPHPRLAERAFVLIPLNEIAPDAIVPRRGKSVARLLTDLLEAASSKSEAVVLYQSHAWSTR